MGRSIVRQEADSSRVVCDCFLLLAQVAVGVAAKDVSVAAIWIQSDGLCAVGCGLFVVTVVTVVSISTHVQGPYIARTKPNRFNEVFQCLLVFTPSKVCL